MTMIIGGLTIRVKELERAYYSAANRPTTAPLMREHMRNITVSHCNPICSHLPGCECAACKNGLTYHTRAMWIEIGVET
jgi:hypothetical protein